MKSTDFLTKRKPKVEVFFWELVSQERITIAPRGSKAAPYTQITMKTRQSNEKKKRARHAYRFSPSVSFLYSSTPQFICSIDDYLFCQPINTFKQHTAFLILVIGSWSWSCLSKSVGWLCKTLLSHLLGSRLLTKKAAWPSELFKTQGIL